MKPNGHVYILAREHLRAAHEAFTVDRDPVAAAFYLERARDALRLRMTRGSDGITANHDQQLFGGKRHA